MATVRAVFSTFLVLGLGFSAEAGVLTYRVTGEIRNVQCSKPLPTGRIKRVCLLDIFKSEGRYFGLQMRMGSMPIYKVVGAAPLDIPMNDQETAERMTLKRVGYSLLGMFISERDSLPETGEVVVKSGIASSLISSFTGSIGQHGAVSAGQFNVTADDDHP